MSHKGSVTNVNLICLTEIVIAGKLASMCEHTLIHADKQISLSDPSSSVNKKLSKEGRQDMSQITRSGSHMLQSSEMSLGIFRCPLGANIVSS